MSKPFNVETEPFDGKSPTGHLKTWRTPVGASATNPKNIGVGSFDKGIADTKTKKA